MWSNKTGWLKWILHRKLYLHGAAVGRQDVAHPVCARGVLAVDVKGDGAAGLVVHAPKVLLLAAGRVVGPAAIKML